MSRNDRCSRRRFFARCASLGTGVALSTAWLAGCGDKGGVGGQNLDPELLARCDSLRDVAAYAHDAGPVANTEHAIELLGGIDKFVKSGDNVVVKPNIAWNKPPKQAANTNPAVVATVVALCKKAGARSVTVFDRPCDRAEATYHTSGIAEAAENAGAEVTYVKSYLFREIDFPDGKLLPSWQLYGDAVDADVFINLPVAKDHDQARLTMCMKNLMGIQGGQRQSMHKELDGKLADLAGGFRTVLNVLDATRILVRNGPNGISLQDVLETDVVLAGTSPVTVDAFACKLFAAEFALRRSPVACVRIAAEAGLGQSDPDKITVRES